MQSKGNMYDFVTDRWNPLAGECKHRCSYCYVGRLKKRFDHINKKYSGELRLNEKEMAKNLGSGKTIFVCSCNDLFQNGAYKFAESILEKINKYQGNTYVLQTKNPFNASLFHTCALINYFVGTTIESNLFYSKIMNGCNSPVERARGFKSLRFDKKFITIEPILDFSFNGFVDMLIDCNPDQINIGADSGNNHLPEPSKEKILSLIEILKNETSAKIVLKPNLNRLIK